jgi:hypothetical protein
LRQVFPAALAPRLEPQLRSAFTHLHAKGVHAALDPR